MNTFQRNPIGFGLSCVMAVESRVTDLMEVLYSNMISEA